MIIGVLKETVEGEFRVAATPETVKKLISLKLQAIGHENLKFQECAKPKFQK